MQVLEALSRKIEEHRGYNEVDLSYLRLQNILPDVRVERRAATDANQTHAAYRRVRHHSERPVCFRITQAHRRPAQRRLIRAWPAHQSGVTRWFLAQWEIRSWRGLTFALSG